MGCKISRFFSLLISNNYVTTLWHLNLYVLLLQNLKKSSDQWHELFSVDCFISIDVKQVEDVFDVIFSRGLCAYQLSDHLDNSGKLFLAEPVVSIFIKFVKYFFFKICDHFLSVRIFKHYFIWSKLLDSTIDQ